MCFAPDLRPAFFKALHMVSVWNDLLVMPLRALAAAEAVSTLPVMINQMACLLLLVVRINGWPIDLLGIEILCLEHSLEMVEWCAPMIEAISLRE